MKISKLVAVVLLSSLASLAAVGCGGTTGTEDTSTEGAQALVQTDANATKAIQKALAVGVDLMSESDSNFAYAEGPAPTTHRVSAAAVVSELSQTISQGAQAQDRPDFSFKTSRAFTMDAWFQQNDTDPDSPDTDPGQVGYYANLKNLRTALEANLTDLKVYRYGVGINPRSHEVLGPTVTVVIAGKLPSGRLAAVFAFAVET